MLDAFGGSPLQPYRFGSLEDIDLLVGEFYDSCTIRQFKTVSGKLIP
jgi:hypothetical protein